jgi:hypothetical protein
VTTSRVYVDESIRQAAGGYVYVLAAVRPTESGAPLADLQRTLLPGQRYIHWRTESDERRHELTAVINTMAVDVTLAVIRNVENRQQEHARAAGVRALALEFDHAGLSAWEIERRRGALDDRDRSTVNALLRAGEVEAAPEIHFVRKSSSPAIWVADATATTASEYFAGTGRSDHWWRTLRFKRLVVLDVDA